MFHRPKPAENFRKRLYSRTYSIPCSVRTNLVTFVVILLTRPADSSSAIYFLNRSCGRLAFDINGVGFMPPPSNAERIAQITSMRVLLIAISPTACLK